MYYNNNEYTFTPLQHYEQQQQQLQQQQQQPGASVFPAERDDFVIEMQTYQQCPDCPTFSVPVPVPKFQETFPVERNEDKSLIAKLADIVRPVITRARTLITGDQATPDTITSRVDTPHSPTNNKMAAPFMASLAAIGMGLATYFTSNLSGNQLIFCCFPN